MIYKINCNVIFIILFLHIACAGILYPQISNEMSDFNYGKELYDDRLYDLASLQFSDFIQKYPSSPHIAQASFLLAESYFFAQKTTKAKEAYIKYIIHYPSDNNIPKAYYRIGECYENLEEINEAVVSYLRLKNINSDNQWYFRGLLKAALLSIEMEKYAQAESILISIINSNPEGEYISRTWVLYSKLYFEQGSYKKSIDILESLLEKSISTDEKCGVIFRLAEIYQRLGFLEIGIHHYQQIIDNFDIPLYKQKAFYNIGLINRLKGNNEIALTNFRNATQITEDTSVTVNAFINAGNIYMQKDDFDNSLSSFNSALNLDSLNYKALFGKAMSLAGLNSLQSAEDIFTNLLQDSSLPVFIKKKILLHNARLSDQISTVSERIDYYNIYISEFPEDELIDIVLLQKGKLCLQNGLWDEGYYSLRKIWKEYPDSRLIPEAKYIYAHGLEKVGRYQEAKSLYRFITENYALSLWDDESYKRIQFINKFISKNYDKGLLKLSDIIKSTNNTTANTLTLGKIYFYNFKNYKKAVSIFKTFTNEKESLPSISNELYFLLGEAYKNLYIRDQKEGYQDSSRYYHIQNIQNSIESDYSKRSCLSLAELLSKQSIQESYRLIKMYPFVTVNDSLDYEFIYKRANCLFKSDSLAKSLKDYSLIARDSIFTKYKEHSLFKCGEIYYLNHSYEKSDSVFYEYLSTYKKGKYFPAVLFYQARLNEKLNNYNIAVNNYKKISDLYFYSVYKDSSDKYLGTVYLKTGKYNKAVQHYEHIIRQDSILQVAKSAGLVTNQSENNHINYLFKLAQSYQLSNNLAKAQSVYLNYGKSVTSEKNKIKYYTALSTIAEQRSDTLRAVEYLEHLFTLNPSDTVAAALGDLFLQTKEYDKAREIFNQGINISDSEDIKCRLSAKIIISLLKEKKIPQADVRIKIFEQSFKNLDCREQYLAEFYLEKGKAYIEQKDFDEALKFLKKIDDRKQFQQLAPQAQFQIGRIYLIINKTDKALDVLTYLTEHYEEHPISYKVYMNLGYHYYRSQQYENAIHALKQASSSPDSNIRKTTYRILIKIYEENGLLDNALKITRDYIDEFPDADDILQQKIKIGTLLMGLHEYDRAIEQLKSLKVYADSESEARIQYWIAKSYYNMGQFKKSIFEFLKVQYLSQSTKLPWKTTAMYEASKAYIKLQEFDKASDLLRRIIQIEGTTSSMGRFAVDQLQEIKSRSQ